MPYNYTADKEETEKNFYDCAAEQSKRKEEAEKLMQVWEIEVEE